jgi:hypothetical protein
VGRIKERFLPQGRFALRKGAKAQGKRKKIFSQGRFALARDRKVRKGFICLPSFCIDLMSVSLSMIISFKNYQPLPCKCLIYAMYLNLANTLSMHSTFTLQMPYLCNVP